MICPNCNREIEDGALYCCHCGSSMNSAPEMKPNKSSVILLVWTIAAVMLYMARILYHRVSFPIFPSPFIYPCIDAMCNMIMILPVLTIKDKKNKTASIIIMSLYIAFMLFRDIRGILYYL